MIMNVGYSPKDFLRGGSLDGYDVEQILMRSMKTQGGLTHGSGWSVF